jgi:hypothetical protein
MRLERAWRNPNWSNFAPENPSHFLPTLTANPSLSRSCGGFEREKSFLGPFSLAATRSLRLQCRQRTAHLRLSISTKRRGTISGGGFNPCRAIPIPLAMVLPRPGARLWNRYVASLLAMTDDCRGALVPGLGVRSLGAHTTSRLGLALSVLCGAISIPLATTRPGLALLPTIFAPIVGRSTAGARSHAHRRHRRLLRNDPVDGTRSGGSSDEQCNYKFLFCSCQAFSHADSGSVRTSGLVKGFGRRPLTRRSCAMRGRRSKAPQGGNRGEEGLW